MGGKGARLACRELRQVGNRMSELEIWSELDDEFVAAAAAGFVRGNQREAAPVVLMHRYVARDLAVRALWQVAAAIKTAAVVRMADVRGGGAIAVAAAAGEPASTA